MTVDPALTAGEQAALNAGGHTVKRYLSVYEETVVLNTTVNAVVGFPATHIDTADTPTTAVKRGMTFEVVGRGYYRVTADGDGVNSYLKVGPLGSADPGLLNQSNRLTPITSGDVLKVYDRYDLWGAYPDYSGGAWREDGFSYADWTTYVKANNRYPAAVVNIGKHRSTWVDSGQTYATLTFTAQVLVWIEGSVSYAWDIPDSWTVTAGSSATASFTAQVPAGFYILDLTVTHDTSYYTTAHRCVWVHDADHPPIPIAEVVSDERDRTGRQMVIKVNDNTLASIPDGAMVNYWEEATWGGTTVPTATTNFTGWITREGWRIDGGIRSAELGILGPAELLRSMPAYSQYLDFNGVTAGNFQQILWQGIQPVIHDLLWKRAANLLNLFDFHFAHNADSPPQVTVTTWALPSWAIASASNLLEQIQALCQSARLNYGHASSGAMYLQQHPSELDPSTRGTAVVTRDYLTTNRYTWPVTFDRLIRPTTRHTVCRAFNYNGVSISPKVSESPGGGMGQGANEEVVNDLVTKASNGITAQADNDMLTGQIQAAKNNPLPDVPFQIPDNRDVYEPAQMPFVQSDIPADQAPDGVGWTGANGVPTRVIKHHNLNGTAHIELHLEMETSNITGSPITVPSP